MVKFGLKPAFLHPCYLSGRELAQIQPTLDPKLINLYAEVFHMFFITSLNHFKSKNVEVCFRDEVWLGMVGLILGEAVACFDHKMFILFRGAVDLWTYGITFRLT